MRKQPKNLLVTNPVLTKCLEHMSKTRRKQAEQADGGGLDTTIQSAPVLDEHFLRQARAKLVLVNRYLGTPKGRNVVGVGIGNKITEGVDTGVMAVRVYVSNKPEEDDLTKAARVPPDFADMLTDVIETDHRLSPFSRVRRPDQDPDPRSDIGPGSSIGPEVANVPNRSPNIAGTLGAVLCEEDNSKARYILSCNHVLAVQGRVRRQTDIISPGPDEMDPDRATIHIAKRSAMVRLEHDGFNTVDCALAEIIDGAVKGRFPDYEHIYDDGRAPEPESEVVFDQNHRDVNAYAYPIEGMEVIKFGRTTGWTNGRIVDVFADVLVDYNFGTFHFSNQVLIEGDGGPFAADGDSGAVVLMLKRGARPTPVAMVFAPAGSLCVACPMPSVIERLETELRRQPGKERVTLQFEGSCASPWITGYEP